MSLKLVELQVALPRMNEIGKIQEQLQQQSGLAQAQLAAAMQKRQERAKRQVTSKQTTQSACWEKEKHGIQHKQVHPYKGKNIDLMG
ncbi:hypothetical protein AT864_01166 [Anoxybacillus sp. P3H1B]|uniref:hypothetical protein n=1 Tax=Anoxybacillaceae TaxID=3120669 RepID=UPI00079C3188|nr:MULTISPECIES: hypothetical protein [Anoxybacillus]KXG10575.1 hypothetical protein AT864_01166 [Anoxybacillus sp. P3H1B]MBB3906141.1 hypothetical protein [Anoxybacillus rupiensis]